MRLAKSILIIGISGILACNGNEKEFDASGSFEAVETTISAEGSGILTEFELAEGQQLEKGQVLGFIDTTQLHLRKKQIEAQMQALLSRKPDISVQLASLQSQLDNAENEKKRIENLLEDDAATTKQLDDIQAQIDYLKGQIQAQRATLNTSINGIDLDANTLAVQIEQLLDQINKSRITSPISGTVLAKYVEPHEMTQTGKPLFKIADISKLTLRAYFSGDQLSQIKLGQEVTVRIDGPEGEMKEYKGSITWISDKAEFTPKTIQTKNERANLVYATKIIVVNDGQIKIGMYGEVSL